MGSELHYTKTVDMFIGDHTNKRRFELADMPSGHLDGYLPMAWLKDDNSDLHCAREVRSGAQTIVRPIFSEGRLV